MPYELSVDLGTTFTAAAVLAPGDEPRMIGLGNRALQVPSVLFRTDSGFVVGEAAERRGAAEPGRLVREFKRRLGDEVPLLVGGEPYPAEELTAVLLRWVLDEVSRQQGERPSGLVLTHPANWGPYKLDVLARIAARAGAGPTRWCAEPVAAAAQYAARARVEPGQRLGVYDLGGGTFDACVLEKTGTGFRMLGPPEGVEHLGGSDFDEALFRRVVDGLGDALAALDPADEAVTLGLSRLRRDCVEAKEALSSEVDTVVQVALPGLVSSVRVSRAELEALIRPPLEETVAAMSRAVRAAGLPPDGLAGIVLVGGSSRIPLVGEVLQRHFHLPPALDTHPKHDIALGALRVRDGAVAPGPAPTRRRRAVPARPSPVPATGTAAREPEPLAVEPAAPTPARPTSPPPTVRSAGSLADVAGADPVASGGVPAGLVRRRLPLLIGAGAALVVAAVVTAVALNGGGGPGTVEPSLAPVPTLSAPTPGPSTPAASSPAAAALPRSAPLAANQLIVSMQIGGNWDLYLAATDTADPLRRLTSGPAADFTPVLSPDRASVIYQHDPDVNDRVRTLRVAAVDGSHARELFAKVPSVCAGLMYRPAWDPADPTLLAVPCTDGRGRYGLYLFRTDGTLVQRVSTDGDRADDPTFGPDGRLVFWAGPLTAAQKKHPSLADGRLWVRETDGTVRRLPLIGGQGHDADPAWSPDGRALAFRRRNPDGSADGNLDIYVVRMDGRSRPLAVAAGKADEEDPTWSPDGGRIAYKSNRATPSWPGPALPRTWVMDADGGDPHLLLTADAPGQQTAPAWTSR